MLFCPLLVLNHFYVILLTLLKIQVYRNLFLSQFSLHRSAFSQNLNITTFLMFEIQHIRCNDFDKFDVPFVRIAMYSILVPFFFVYFVLIL